MRIQVRSTALPRWLSRSSGSPNDDIAGQNVALKGYKVARAVRFDGPTGVG